jgi:hypothetical protein
MLFLALVAIVAAFLAPGNLNRLEAIDEPVRLDRAAVNLAASSVYLLVNWLGNGLLLAATALALPALAQLAARPNTPAYSLRQLNPLVLGTGLLLLLVATGLPSYAATGVIMPLRARTAVYLMFLVGWLVLVLAGLGWAQRKQRSWGAIPAAWPRPIAALLWAWLLLSFATDRNTRVERANLGRGSNNIVLAYWDWLSGTAARYDTQQQARYRALVAQPGQDLKLAPLAAIPSTLHYADITPDKTHWRNTGYAQFFGLRSVAIDSTRAARQVPCP